MATVGIILSPLTNGQTNWVQLSNFNLTCPYLDKLWAPWRNIGLKGVGVLSQKQKKDLNTIF